MKVSIIIPTYNRLEKLRSLLNDIVVTDHNSVKEVIVCDDGSTADISSVINSIESTIPIHHLVHEDLGFRAGTARNMGIAAAKGDIILFVDDDVKLSARFIDAHIKRHEELNCKSVVFGFRYRTYEKTGSILSLDEPNEEWIQDSRVFEIGEDGEKLIDSPYPWFYVYSCNFSVRNNPGMPIFDPTFEGWGMEDIEYAYRLHYLGYKICYEKNAWLLHIESLKPRDPFRCEELSEDKDIEKNYDTYVQNCMRFMQKYPNDWDLRELIKTDLSWYVQDEKGTWVKNGYTNDFGDVMKAYEEGVPVKKEIIEELTKDFKSNVLDDSPITNLNPKLLKRQLDEIAIELTVYCNLKCEMCSVWELKKHGIANERAKLMLDEAYELGARTFIPCGAESFMRKDFLELVEYAHNMGYTQQEIVTNGLMLTEAIMLKLKKLNSVYLHISIDGPEHIHDRLRGEGSYGKLMKILARLKHHSIRFGISSVIMRETLPFLSHIVDLASDFGLDEISVQPFQYEISGDNKDNKRFSFLKHQQTYLIHELNELYNRAKSKNIKLFTESLFYTIPDYLISGERPIPPDGCHMPSRFLLIDYQGNVYPCFFMRDETMGDANKDSLKTIWHSSIHNKMQEIALTKICPGCLAACSDIASFNESQNKIMNHA